LKSEEIMEKGVIKNFFLGCFLGVIAIFLFLTGAALVIKERYRNRAYPGIFIFENLVSGKTLVQLEDFLEGEEQKIAQQKVIFLWKNGSGEEKRWEIIPQMIDWSLDKKATIDRVLAIGREGGKIKSFFSLYQRLVFPLEAEPVFDYNPEKLNLIVAQIAAEINRPTQNALFEFKDGKVISFQVSKKGREVNQKEVKELVTLVFSRNKKGNPLVALNLPVKEILPEITTQQSNQLGIKELLAEGESFFKDSIPSRVHNIILASSYLHGVVIPPGEIFSFSQRIGTISAEVGYKPAYVIKNKATVLEDGGGVCQVSTTLFRAALNAGLPIIERHPHYYRVGFYEQGGYPPGLDATVYPPSPDLKFQNDTLAYILIQTIVDKEAKRLVFQLYGTADGRRVEISKPIIHSQTPPPEPIYVDEPNLPMGVVKKIDSPHWGAKVSFTRRVFNAEGNLIEEKTFWSNYVAWPAVYQRGIRQ